MVMQNRTVFASQLEKKEGSWFTVPCWCCLALSTTKATEPRILGCDLYGCDGRGRVPGCLQGGGVEDFVWWETVEIAVCRLFLELLDLLSGRVFLK